MSYPKPPTVLFVSTGNAARSILAEALLRAKGGHRFHVRSAGVRPLPQIDPHTVALLTVAGIPTDSLHSKNVGEFLAAAHLVKIDVIVTLSEEARQTCPPWPGSGVTSLRYGEENYGANLSGEVTPGPVRVHWTLDDPLSAEKEDVREWKFRKCFLTLETRISALIKAKVAHSASELLLQLKDIGMVV